MLINPAQLPLREPYFDLTLIRVAHTKNTVKLFLNLLTLVLLKQ